MTSTIKAVVFDLDFTLCEYALTVGQVTAQAIAETGLEELPLSSEELGDAYNRAWWEAELSHRKPLLELRELAWAHALNGIGIEDVSLARSLSEAYSRIRDETGLRLFDGVSQLIDDLRSRYPLGIVTNGPSDMQWPKLRGLGLVERFDGIVVAGDRGFFKPDPRPFLEILELLGVPDNVAETALFVGDSFEHDIVGAHGAGMRTAWIRSNGQEPPHDTDVRADHVLQVVTDIREILL